MLNDQGVPDALIGYLRESLGRGSLEYAALPARVSGGFDTTIYGFGLRGAHDEATGPLVLRLFGTENLWIKLSSSDRARFDGTVQNTVRGLGYPAPRVVVTCTDAAPLGAPFVVMDRVPGKLMLELFFRPSPLLIRLPKLLAEAQARLHDLDPSRLVVALKTAGFATSIDSTDWLERIDEVAQEANLKRLAPGLTWLRDKAPPRKADAICHGDFHPLNFLVEHGQVSGVIDWSWIRLGQPEYDVGATIALFRQGPLQMPPVIRAMVDTLRNLFVRRYLAEYRKLRPLDMTAVAYYEALRCMGFLSETGLALQTGVERSVEFPFGKPATVRRIARRFREITGTTVSIARSAQ